MKKTLSLILMMSLGINASYGTDTNNNLLKPQRPLPENKSPESEQKNYIMKPGHLMQQVPAQEHYESNEIIINNLPNGSYFYHGTRTLPIIIERNYYNTTPPIQYTYPPLNNEQQQSNRILIENILNSSPTTVVDAGFGYFVPNSDNQIYYHSKISKIAPMRVEEFLISDEYKYLTGQ